MADAIPLGQPILTDHYSARRDTNYRARFARGFERGFEHADKARDMARRADGIEAAAAGAIYSDDVDAVEQLRAKLERLEAERERWKAYNAACRRARARSLEALELLDARQQAALYSVAQHSGYSLGRYGEAPAYVLSNLGGNITRTRKRLAQLERTQRHGDND